MRIAIFLDTWFPQIDGVVISTVSFAEQMVKKGHQVLIVGPLGRQPSNYISPQGIEIIQVPSMGLPSYPDYRIAGVYSQSVHDQIKRFNPDVIHCQTPFSLGWMGVIMGRILHKPTVGTYHTLLPEFLMYLPIPVLKDSHFSKKATWAVTNFFYNQLTMNMTPSHTIRKLLRKQGVKNVKVIPNGITTELFPLQTIKPPTRQNVELAYVGRISFEKNIDVLLDGVHELNARGINARLRIIGAGPAMDSLKEKTKTLKIEKKVLFKGMISHEKIADALKGSHLAVTASTMETQGLVILESMSLGMPCVGANAMAIPEAIKPAHNGFLFKPRSVKQLADECEKLIDQPKRWKKLSQNARKTALTYEMGVRTKALVDFYQQAIKKFKRQKPTLKKRIEKVLQPITKKKKQKN